MRRLWYWLADRWPLMLKRTHRAATARLIEQQAILRDIGTDDQGFHVNIQHWGVRLLADSFAQSFLSTGAENYMTWTVTHPAVGQMELTLRKAHGKTPAQHLAEQREKIAELEARLRLASTQSVG